MHQVFLIRIGKSRALSSLDVARVCEANVSLGCKDNYSLALGGASASCEGWKCPLLKRVLHVR